MKKNKEEYYKIEQTMEWTNIGLCLVKRHYVKLFGLLWFPIRVDKEQRNVDCFFQDGVWRVKVKF
ncbi:MAG: hypothetical protein PHC64_08400 [Candidatus Gastranaerophilales bacterium]|nr:hypothetical protein [Candidatus Gastranaerophilales bacterium]